MLIFQHMTGGKEKRENCQTCIMDKAKAGSSTRFERTLINRVDGWSPVVLHPHKNPFPFLVCWSLSHCLPFPKLASHYILHRFSSLADSTTHKRFLR